MSFVRLSVVKKQLIVREEVVAALDAQQRGNLSSSGVYKHGKHDCFQMADQSTFGVLQKSVWILAANDGSKILLW